MKFNVDQVQYASTDAKYLTDSMLKALAKVSLGATYVIKEHYKRFIERRRQNKKLRATPIIYAIYQGAIIGQVIATKYSSKPEWDVNVFVFKKYRRLGIGTKLLKLMIKTLNKDKATKYCIFPHDDRSYIFYNKQLKKNKQFARKLKKYDRQLLEQYSEDNY